jgi:IclR family transcriptional regulator, KDG regulon repressor
MRKEEKNTDVSAESVKKENAVQSVRRAAEILNCISNGISSVTEIAAKCGLSKSTVHRLLKALGESELVMQDPVNHQYFLGYAIIKLISTPLATQEFLTSCAAAEMTRLSELTGETVSLGIKMGMKSVNIHVVTSKSDLKVDGANLRIRPIHLGIDGSMLLSQLDDYQVSNILDNIRLELKTKPEKFKTRELLARIQAARQQGYAIGNSELTLGVTCISAPVKNYALPAALSLVGPEVRMKPNIKKLVREVVECAARISAKLKERANTGLNNP